MFHCEKCWDTPCTCGKQYENKDSDEMAIFIHGIIKNRDDVNDVIGKLIKLEKDNRNKK